MFSTVSDTVSLFVYIFDIISLFAVELEESKIGISGEGSSRFWHVIISMAEKEDS